VPLAIRFGHVRLQVVTLAISQAREPTGIGPTMTKIILVRHGHVEGINPPRFRGRAEVPLTELGMRQARETAERIRGSWRPVAVYTSPMGRCVATGQAISEATGVSCQPLDGLIDLDYGAWQWKTYDEMQVEVPKLFALWRTAPHMFRFPGGDSLQDLLARAADSLRFVLDRHPEQIVVMVGHDSVNRALLLQLLDQPLSAYWRLAQDPCAISEIDITDARTCVRRINETQHLAGIPASK
jgi:broad specificity phosphatase PhoE